MKWIQHVDFEKEFVAHVITVEGNTLNKSDVPNEGDFSLVHVAAVADCKCMVDG